VCCSRSIGRLWVSAVLVFFIVRLLTGHVFFGSLALGLALAIAAILLHPGRLSANVCR
jgi:hypothetical protein